MPPALFPAIRPVWRLNKGNRQPSNFFMPSFQIIGMIYRVGTNNRLCYDSDIAGDGHV